MYEMKQEKHNHIERKRKCKTIRQKKWKTFGEKENHGNKMINADTDGSHLCNICYETIHDHGRIDSCSHSFCLNCIEQWAKSSTICPMCRKRFFSITGISHFSKTKGQIHAIKKRVPLRDFKDEIDDEEYYGTIALLISEEFSDQEEDLTEVDENGNLKGFIVNDDEIEYDENMDTVYEESPFLQRSERKQRQKNLRAIPFNLESFQNDKWSDDEQKSDKEYSIISIQSTPSSLDNQKINKKRRRTAEYEEEEYKFQEDIGYNSDRTCVIDQLEIDKIVQSLISNMHKVD